MSFDNTTETASMRARCMANVGGGPSIDQRWRHELEKSDPAAVLDMDRRSDARAEALRNTGNRFAEITEIHELNRQSREALDQEHGCPGRMADVTRELNLRRRQLALEKGHRLVHGRSGYQPLDRTPAETVIEKSAAGLGV
ncbi:MAG: hypothetical protein OXU45_01395 [Candidatus Melainabacteria bacterium]|nr:hypothetical protein [Candidatus Melainabacteria bacterium]